MFSPFTLELLAKIWKHKFLPPRIKAFAWRLIRHALSTRNRAARFSSKIDNTCKFCGSLETDFHLFFQCNFSRAVWFYAHPSLRIDMLPYEDDRVQGTLQLLLQNNFSHDLLQKMLTRLWYLWKARNDFRFNNKQWSIQKIWHEINADIQSSTLFSMQGMVLSSARAWIQNEFSI